MAPGKAVVLFLSGSTGLIAQFDYPLGLFEMFTIVNKLEPRLGTPRSRDAFRCDTLPFHRGISLRDRPHYKISVPEFLRLFRRVTSTLGDLKYWVAEKEMRFTTARVGGLPNLRFMIE